MSLAGPWTLSRQLATGFSSLFAIILVAFLSFGSQSADSDWGLGRTLTSTGLSVIAGLVTWTGVQWLLSSRHRMLATMAKNNLIRRKRNTALVIVGLLVGSAIVTSSLVIGDSLDATMDEQFLAPLGDTDFFIRGKDPLTTLWTEWNQTRANALADELAAWDDIHGVRPGLSLMASALHTEQGLGEPMVTWYAFDAERSGAGGFDAIGGSGGLQYSDILPGNVVINEELADSISAGPGDLIEIHWIDVDLEVGIIRGSTNLTVQQVIPDVSTGHRNSRQPLIFTPLDAAQSITGKTNLINHIGIAARGDGSEALQARIIAATDLVLIAEDAGLIVETDADQGMIAVARNSGFGQLDVGEVSNLSVAVDAVGIEVQSLELLQVPLFNVAQSWFNLSGLASASISSIEQTDSWDWYATGSGLSLQDESGQWWVWTPEDEDAVSDVLVLGDSHGLISHSMGVHEVDLAPGAADGDHLEGLDISALGRIGDTVLALEENAGDVTLHQASLDLSSWTSTSLASDGSAMSIDLATDADEIIVRIGGLLGSRTCTGSVEIPLTCLDDANERRDLFGHGGATWILESQTLSLLDAGSTTPAWSLGLPNGTLLASDAGALWVEDEGLWAWNGAAFSALAVDLPPAASSNEAELSLRGDRLIVTTGDGVAISDEGNLSGRIPSRIRIDAINRVPLTVIALDGQTDMGFPEVEPGRIVVSGWAGRTLDLAPGEGVRLRGYLPVIRGQLDGERLLIDSANLTLPSPPGQPSFDAISFGVVSIEDAELLAGGGAGDRTLVILTGPNLFNASNFTQMEAAVLAWADVQADLQTSNLKVVPIKRDVLESTADAGENFSMLFLIFGSFVIFAGVLLVMNIFVMLADERKPEMGMARAIGMQRSDLRALFVQEGALLGLFSSALGALAGIGVAWVLMRLMAVAFRDTLGWDVVFDWSVQSLLAGFATGFLVTWQTLWLTSLWISRLNVVAAIRSIPTRYHGGLPWWSILITLFLGFSAFASLGLAFLVGTEDGGSRHAWWLFGGFMLMIAAVPPAFYVLRLVLPEDIRFGGMRFHRPVILPRLVLSLLGLSMLLWGWKGDPISADWEQGPFSFIVLGLFMVGAGVLLLSSLAPVLARFGARMLARTSSRLAAVLPTSLAYPLATPFRTAMTMGMFSLVVFAVVVLSGYSALFGNFIGELGEESGGDFEIIAVGSELDPDVSNWDLGEANVSDFDAIAVISSGVVRAERADGSGEEVVVAIRGFDANFSDHGALALDAWGGATEADTWEMVLSADNLVIVDFSLAPQHSENHQPPTLNLKVGDVILISDPSNSGVNQTVTVAGILKQESSLMLPGVYMGSDFAQERFAAEPNVVWFSLPEGTDVATQEALADEIERGMIEEGVAVFVIAVVFAKAQAFFLSMFSLLQAFLALGLAVGIAGLAVVTIRNVSERRHQIGILRALGFQRGMVVATFLIELSWISFLGILNGALVGIGFHYALYERFLKEDGASFIMPWGEIALIVVSAYILTVIATVWPVRKAASIRPAEALRDAD